jgi:hypothetical protein
MTCPMMMHLGVYALGAAEPGESSLVESHLAGCPACRAELDRLAPLPGLLSRVPALLLTDDPLPVRPPRRAVSAGHPNRQTRVRGAYRRSWPVALVSAAAAAAGVGYWLASPAPSSPPAATTLTAVNPATHVRATITLTATSWGTSIRVRAVGLPLNQPCQLIVRSRAGVTEVAGSWDAWRRGPVTIPASASWRPADIASFQVATATRGLLTITARPQRG